MKRYAVSAHSYTCPTIQAGKRYEVLDWDEQNGYAIFNIKTTDTFGDPFEANCLASCPCAFLEGERWTIIEEKEPSDD